jgi:hypothetical protein
MEKIVSKKARQLARVLQDIYKSITIENQSTLRTALQLYFGLWCKKARFFTTEPFIMLVYFPWIF